ncbi:N-6 DNA methylase [Chryseolinea sp. T2]|uniref:restriction endonuclease subunit M n=1 Tax=Chryseolinea sp. T2 TaxID=3129255 RepID=UPI0030788013
MTKQDLNWYANQIVKHDPKGVSVKVDLEKQIISYSPKLRTDETSHKNITPEELVHALVLAMLCSKKYGYQIESIYHEKYFRHGSAGSLSDEVDFMIYDEDELPYALWEIKEPREFKSKAAETIEFQLFGTALLTGVPKYLVYATVFPEGETAVLSLQTINYTDYQSFQSWTNADSPAYNQFPIKYQDIDYEPLRNGGSNDLRTDCTQADFRGVAATFHNEFFGEHADNSLFINLVKCLLAKIYDERTTVKNGVYKFQVLQKNGKPESAEEVFKRINEELYMVAFKRYIDPVAKENDEINRGEFPPEKVKTVVKAIQSMSITKGASIHGDVIGAFFEEILRFGFKQDKGMYFTHDNLVSFMLQVVDLNGLVEKVWSVSTHPDNRLPYIIDPACGSGTFLLKAMNTITGYVKRNSNAFKADLEAEEFFNARLSESKPNYWAENFIYGMDPKFIMAITAKVNMVLHGDGSAHIYKYDAYKDFNSYEASNLRPAPEKNRAISKTKYPFETCESFDLIVSNPPFGVSLSSETKSKLSKVFSLKESLPSEALFIERCFQLLKQNGRMALVLPESILNSGDNAEARIFLYRTFKIKTIVSLPRNIFKDTPTLCSLLFAQKKTTAEIATWDETWEAAEHFARTKVKLAKKFLSELKMNKAKLTPAAVKDQFISMLSPVVSNTDWLIKRGKNPSVQRINFALGSLTSTQVVSKCIAMLATAGFEQLITNYCFKVVADKLNYSFPAYAVDEVGYKLSNRKEKIRPNQLCKFVGLTSKLEKPNLHLMDEDFELVINIKKPQTVLDHIKTKVKWD